MIAIGSSPNWGEGDLQRMSARQATGHSKKKGTPLEDDVAGCIGLQLPFKMFTFVLSCKMLFQDVVPRCCSSSSLFDS